MATTNDIRKLISVTAAYYPNFYRGMTDSQLMTQVRAWELVLKPYEYKDLEQALVRYVSSDTKGFAPTPGQIISFIHRDMSENGEEAWAMVRKAVNSDRYSMAETFGKLPDMIQKAVGDYNSLIAWGNVPTEEFETVIHSQFIKCYEAVKKRHMVDIMTGQALPDFGEHLRIGGK